MSPVLSWLVIFGVGVASAVIALGIEMLGWWDK